MSPRQKKLERQFWRNGLKPKLEAMPGMEFDRIETGTTAKSVPDVFYSYRALNRAGHHGWIELKACEIDDNDCVDLGHFTPGQRRWLKNHGEIGESCFLMIRADSQVFLISWERVASVPRGKAKIKHLKELSTGYWDRGIKIKDLKELL